MNNNPYTQLLETQRAHFHKNVKLRSLWERKKVLKKLKSWIKKNEELIITELAKDFGKSREEILLSEIKPVIGEIKEVQVHLRYWAQSDKKKTPLALFGSSSKVIKEPKGNTLIIAPWNFPFMLAIGPMVSAIAAGCTVVIKPSENTPHCANLIEKLIKEVFEPNEVACVLGAVKETSDLLELKWDHIFFTGSPQVGKIIMGAAAKHLTSVTLELGGHNPVIIDEKCNLKDTAQKLIWGKYMNCGQSCISPNYILVPKSIKADFINALNKQYDKIFGEDGSKAKNAFAHIVNENHFNRVNKLITASKDEGHKVIRGGTSDASCNYIAPTIIDGIKEDSTIFNEEIFGPILPIMEYTDIDAALEMINRKEKPLALYVFTKSRKFGKKIIRNTSAGASIINDTTIHFTHPNLPFGGVNGSGIGKAHGEYGFKEFTNERAMIKQVRGLSSPKIIYPPYNGFKRFVIKLVTWWL